MTGITGDAVGALLVTGKTVGNTVWFVVTGVALAGTVIGPAGNVHVDKFGRRWFAGTVIVESGYDVADARGADVVTVIDAAFDP